MGNYILLSKKLVWKVSLLWGEICDITIVVGPQEISGETEGRAGRQ